MRSFLLSIVLALTIATPAVADPAFGPSGCLNWPPPPGTPQSADTHPEDPFTIVDFTGGAPIEAWRSDWVARGIWATLTALYGSPGSSLPRVPILVTTHDEMVAIQGVPTPAGIGGGLCDASLGAGMVMDAAPVIVGGDALPQVVIFAHELGHVFQIGAAGRIDYRGSGRDWWQEATADLAAWRAVPDEYVGSNRLARAYRRYVGHPEVPLNAYAIGDVTQPRSFHQYAAVVFADWLGRSLGDGPMLRSTFAAMGAGQTSTDALDAMLRARRSNLARHHARFWVSRIDPDDSYEAARPQRERVGASTRTVRLRTGQLAVDLAGLVPSGIKRLEIRTRGARRDTLLVALAGHAETLDWSDGGSEVFCLEGDEPGARPWPGSLAFVLAADRSGSASADVQVTGSRRKCDREDRLDGLYGGLEGTEGGLFRLHGETVSTLSAGVLLHCHAIDTGARFERSFIAHMPAHYRLAARAFRASATLEEGLRTARVTMRGQMLGSGRAALRVEMTTIPAADSTERCTYRHTFLMRRGRAA